MVPMDLKIMLKKKTPKPPQYLRGASNQATKQPTDQTTNQQPTKQLTDQTTNQQPTKQPNNRITNQPDNQTTPFISTPVHLCEYPPPNHPHPNLLPSLLLLWSNGPRWAKSPTATEPACCDPPPPPPPPLLTKPPPPCRWCV